MSPTSAKGSDGLVGYFVDTREPGVENNGVPLRGAARVVANGDREAVPVAQAVLGRNGILRSWASALAVPKGRMASATGVPASP